MAEELQFVAFFMQHMIEEVLADESDEINIEFLNEAQGVVELTEQAAELLSKTTNIIEEFIYTAEHALP